PVLTLPLALRRRWPTAVNVSILGGLALISAAFGGSEATTGFLVFIVATFTLAAYGRWPLASAAAVVGAAVVHEVRDPHVHGLSDAVWALGRPAIAWLIGWARRTRVRRIGALESEALQAERRHAEQVAAATAAERAAIARELHDIVAHAVSVIVIQAQAGSRALPARTDVAADVLTTIESSARTALAELRRLLTLLSDDGDPATTNP